MVCASRCSRLHVSVLAESSSEMERVVRVKRGRHDTPSEQLLIHTDVAPPSKHARLTASLNQLASGLDSLSVRHNQGCLRPPDATDGADGATVEDVIPSTTSGARVHRSRRAASSPTSKPQRSLPPTGAMLPDEWRRRT